MGTGGRDVQRGGTAAAFTAGNCHLHIEAICTTTLKNVT